MTTTLILTLSFLALVEASRRWAPDMRRNHA